MDYKAIEEKMKKTVSVLESDYAAIRAGRANPAILDKLTIEYYGAKTHINEVAQVSSPEPRMLTINPYDKSVLKEIEKAILVSDIGINPQNDGKIIRLAFPPLTEDRRKELAKGISKTGEDSKVAIRSIRREGIDQFKAMKKKNEITEDDLKEAEKSVQDITDKFIKIIDDMIDKKQKEIMSV